MADAAALAKNPAVFNVIYPVTEGSTFDMEYYLHKHMPLVSKTWSEHGLKSWKIVKLDKSCGYQVQAILEWESVEAMSKALQTAELANPVMGDIVKFTNTTPIRLLGAEVAQG